MPRLTELNAEFVGDETDKIKLPDGTETTVRVGIAVKFLCPCGKCTSTVVLPFANPIDGGPPILAKGGWWREGTTIETLSVTPSVWRTKKEDGCDGHWWLTDGGLKNCF